MKIIKKAFGLLAVLLIMILCVNISVSATSPEYKLTLTSTVDGGNLTSTKFTFTVKCFLFDENGLEPNPLSTDTIILDTSNGTFIDFTFDQQHISTGGYAYTFSLTDCSNKKLVLDNREITVFLGAEMIKLIDSSVEGEGEPDDNLEDGFHETVKFNSTRTAKVEISTNNMPAVTKIYDGTTAATVSNENFTLKGINQNDDVKLAYTKAEFDFADVKTASKVTLNGLSLTGKDASKYTLSIDKLELKGKITARPITVTANNIIMTKGQAEPDLTYTLSEKLIEGNDVVGELARVAGNTVGEYAVTRGTLSFSENYIVTFIDGKLTISDYSSIQLDDKLSGITATGFFDSQSTLTVNAIPEGNAIYSTMAPSAAWGKIISAYDISLNTKGVDGLITFSFKLPPNINNTAITVYQLLPTGAITCYKTTAVNGIVTISSDQCGQFMLVTDKDSINNEKASVWSVILKILLIILCIAIGLALLIVLFVFGMIFFNKTEQLKAIIKFLKKLFKKK